MRKQFNIVALLAINIIIAPDAFGAVAPQKSIIASSAQEAQEKSEVAEVSGQEAPTMMEVFRDQWHEVWKPRKVGEYVIKRIADPEEVPLMHMFEAEQKLTAAPKDAPDKAAYDVFYHAYAGKYRVVQDFYYHVMQFEQQQNLGNFIPVRFWHSFRKYEVLKNSDAMKFIISKKMNSDNDSDLKTAQHILSVNLSFLGNILLTEESTADFYMSSSSASFPWHPRQDSAKLIQEVCDYYDFDAQRIVEMPMGQEGSLIERHKKTRGVLQIFMPRRYTNKIVYVSKVGGVPWNIDLGFGGFKKVGGVKIQTTITPIIDAIRSGKLTEDARSLLLGKGRNGPGLQARIVLGSDVMLNPDSDVKIFRYDSLTDAQRQENEQIMKDACDAMFIDWLERILKGKVKQEALKRISGTPIGKLVQDRKQVEDLIRKLKPRAKL